MGEDGGGEAGGLVEFGVEGAAGVGVGIGFFAVLEGGVVDEEFGLEDVEAFEFVEEVGGGVGGGAEGVGGVLLFEIEESVVRFVEGEVVHLEVAGQEGGVGGRGRGRGRRSGRGESGEEEEDEDQHAR